MDNEQLSAMAQNVAFTIALHRNEQSLLCCPSRERIADKSKLALSTVKRQLKELKRLKVLTSVTIMPVESGREHKYNQYYFNYDLDEAERTANGHSGVIHHFDSARIKLRGNGHKTMGSL